MPTSPLQPSKSGGNQGYAGYEYQKVATVWLSLELIFAKGLTDTITVEPRSQEDIEAALRLPEEASLNVSIAPCKLIIQIKSRSTAPWTSSAFAKVLKGDAKNNKAPGRIWPFDMLLSNAQERYVLVTNEAVEASLRLHTAESLLDFPDTKELPPHARRSVDPATQESIAPRIAICGGLTMEVLENRITRLLENHCHVPARNHSGCVQEMREVVGQRMLGAHGGHLTRDELLKILVKHNGSVLPTRRMDHYVRPHSYERINQYLEQRHAVIIAGPSGTGKTLTADILELAYRSSNPPYEIMGSESGPGPVRSRLADPSPVLFHLRDPWGTNRVTPEAEPWASELPKLVAQANASHKFLVTSRSDVLVNAGTELEKKLAPYIVQIEIEDYDPELLAEIYDRIRSDLTGHSAELAEQFRKAALKALKRPYELDRFLAVLTEQDPEKAQKLNVILERSQIEAISSVVADQVIGRGPDGIAPASIVWALLHARESLTADVLRKVNRLMRRVDATMRPDLEGFVDFLVAGRNLRREGEVLTFYHPRVEDGLRMVIENRRNDTEYFLTCLINGLAMADGTGQDWGIETALLILESARQLRAHSFTLSEDTHKRLDVFLESSLFSEKQGSRAEQAFNNLARHGSKSHTPSIIARLLLNVNKDQRGWGVGRFWEAPQVNASTLEEIRNYPKTPGILGMFIREVLPFSQTQYRETLVPLLYSFATGLNKDFHNAVESVAEPGGPSGNVDVIVHGACYGDDADFEWVIQQFILCDEKASAWLAEFQPTIQKAEEHVLDAASADRAVEEPQEYFHNSDEGLATAVSLRVLREGVSWLRLHEHRERLSYRLAKALEESKEKVSVDILGTMLECTNNRATAVWRTVKKHWDENLRDVLRNSLLSDDLEDEYLRHVLLEVAAGSSAGINTSLAELLPQMSALRRFEILHDLMQTTIEGDAEGAAGHAMRQSRARAIAALFPEPQCELGLAMIKVLAGSNSSQVAAGFPPSALQELQSNLPNAPLSVAGVLTFLASAVDLNINASVDRLLKSGDIDDGIAAVRSLAIQPSVDELLSAFKHSKFQVRCEALEVLVSVLTEEESSVLLTSADDPSADVRLTWAKLMADLHWPEAVESLVRLLKDERNFSSDYGMMEGPVWAEFRVARAAAHALAAYGQLPQFAVNALLEAAESPSDDPFVACACLSAISKRHDTRIVSVLLKALASKGLKGARQYRPLAQAAAWALFDRAQVSKLNAEDVDLTAATSDVRPSIAAPALLATACASARTREAVLRKLRSDNFVYRIELLCAASAVLRNRLLEGATECDRDLAAFASGSTLHELRDHGKALENWSRSLKNDRDVQGYTSWLVKTQLGLLVTESIENPRKFDLPERIGVFSLRSLTPARERVGREPDDGS